MKNRYFHWFDASDGTRLVLKESIRKQLLKEAIAHFGSVSALSKRSNLCKQTIHNYIKGVSMTVGGLKKILDLLEYKYEQIEKDIVELSWCTNISLPIDLSNPQIAMLAAAILGDGTHTVHVEYKNKDTLLIDHVEQAARAIFSKTKINRRVSDKNIPFIILPQLLKSVLFHLNIPQGKQTFTNPHVPKQISTGSEETQKIFLQQFFDDEGSVERNYRRLSISQGVACTDKIPKKYYCSMEIRKPYYIKDISKDVRTSLIAPNVLVDIQEMLESTFNIKSILQFKRIAKQYRGHVSAYWELVINQHASVGRFRDKISFKSKSKQDALEFTLDRDYSLPLNVECLLINKALEISKVRDNFTSVDLAHSLNLPPATVKKKMITLVRRGIFSKIKKGTYSVNIKV